MHIAEAAFRGVVNARTYQGDQPDAVPLNRIDFAQNYIVRIQNEDAPSREEFAADFQMEVDNVTIPRKSRFLGRLFRKQVALALLPVDETGMALAEPPTELLIRQSGIIYAADYYQMLGIDTGIVKLERDIGYLLEKPLGEHSDSRDSSVRQHLPEPSLR